jgi:hypothetical protein
MDKKAQIAIFILVGFVLILIASFLIYINSQGETDLRNQLQPVQETPIEILSIKNYVDKCIEDTAIPPIKLLGLQGGIIYARQPVFITDNEIFHYHYQDGKNTSPSISEMEYEISRFMEQALPSCIDNFSIFKQIGKYITNGSINAQTEISEHVEIRINYPVALYQDQKETTQEEYLIRVPINIRQLYDINQKIIGKAQTDPENLDLTFLSQFNATITVFPHSRNTMVYSIYKDEYIFMFATQTIVNAPPRLDFIPDFVVSAGKRFVYDVNASDNDEIRLLSH